MTASGGVCSFRLLDEAEGLTQSSALCCFVKGDKGMLLWVPQGSLEWCWWGSTTLPFPCLPDCFPFLSFPRAPRCPQRTQHENHTCPLLPYLQTDGILALLLVSPPTWDSRRTPVGGCNWPGVTCHVWAPPCFPDEPDRPLTARQTLLGPHQSTSSFPSSWP